MVQSAYETLQMLKNSVNLHIDLINPAESEFRRGLSGGLHMAKLYIQSELDEHWEVVVDKIIK